MSSSTWMTVREAWQRALYGDDGFYRSARPADHFRTSVHASPLFARAIVTLVRRHGLDTVTDVGAGSGELLSQIQELAPDLTLVGVELRSRPPTLASAIAWRCDLGPTRGLLLANEVLDNIALDVVERDADSVLRLVEVCPATGAERLGPPAGQAECDWLQTWWPLHRAGDRAESGLARDSWWAGVCDVVEDGICLAVDYGHTRRTRPLGGTLTSYRDGRQHPLDLDGHHDVTADVCVDSVADTVGASLQSQAAALADLGVFGRNPPLALADSDPAAYVRALARASQVAELTHTTSRGDGLGDFWWLSCPRGHSGA